MKFCNKCGRQLNDTAKFCSACGAEQKTVENTVSNYQQLNSKTRITYRSHMQNTYVPVIVMIALQIILSAIFFVMIANNENSLLSFICFVVPAVITSVICFIRAKSDFSVNTTNFAQVIYATSIILLLLVSVGALVGLFCILDSIIV